MTELNLICEEPYVIGLLGAISFVSFSLGSIMLTNLIDTRGRKGVVLIASAVTPIGILILIFLSINIYFVYAVMFIIGLTYNPRSSVAYLYGSEFLPKEQKLVYGAYNFTLSGVLQCLSAVYFYQFKDQ